MSCLAKMLEARKTQRLLNSAVVTEVKGWVADVEAEVCIISFLPIQD